MRIRRELHFVLAWVVIGSQFHAIFHPTLVRGEEPPPPPPAQPAQLAPDRLDPEHAAKMARGLELFKSDVRDVLISRCAKCHGADKTEGGFDLTSRTQLLQGGSNGVAIVPGRSDASRLVKLITHREEPAMPEDGDRLDDRQIAAISRWIDLGAPYDRPLVSAGGGDETWTQTQVSDEARDFWSFQPLRSGLPPTVDARDWVRTGVDRFVLAKLAEHQLAPNPPADKRTLIRRAYFDLIGLPPSPDDIARFVADTDPEAYDRLLDRLLASPQHGERWGRHWLDVVRFAESSGFEHDGDRPAAYPYRDFVIRALNADVPYNEFVGWQLAGDELQPHEPLAMMATGFLAAGVFPTQLTEKEFEPARYDELDDIVSTLGTSMLALTIGCARCHDHKFDPIPAADYYRILATFTTTVRSQVDVDLDAEDTSESLKRWDAVRAALIADRDRLGSDDPGRQELDQRIHDHEAARPQPRLTPVLVASEGLPPIAHHADGRGYPHFYPETHFLKRGDVAMKHGVAAPGFLQVLRDPSSTDRWSTPPPEGWRTSYRRRALADWITDTEHGAGNLLARVLVNRLWLHHFGRGLVATPNDFGAQGERPTHPELLDWLARQLIDGGWQIKPLHQLIMTSAVYQQTAAENPAASSDPENRWLWRYTPRRLEAEIIRDTLLEVSGMTDRTMFGPGTLDQAMRRRSIYFTVKRSQLIPMLQIFDSPEPLVSVGERPATTIAPQALMFMNNAEVRNYARRFASRLAPATPNAPSIETIRAGYLFALGREPDAAEQRAAAEFLSSQVASYQQDNRPEAASLALADFCQVLMSTNEFVFVE